MTSDPKTEEARAMAVRLLTSPPARLESDSRARNRLTWSRATEQERRAMLKDCGWL